jgi:outer membrane lipoprotein-sorting protein
MHLFRPVFVLTCTLGAALAPAFGASAADNSLAATLARVDQAAANFKSVSADIRKTSHTAVINENTNDSGKILVKRVRGREVRYFAEFGPQNPMKVLVAGHTAEVYYPNSKTVQIYDLGKYKGMVNQFLLLGFGSNARDLENAYSIKLGGTETVAGQKTTRIELTPKSKDVAANITKVDLWIADDTDDSGTVVQQKVYEPGGDYLLATYTNIKINPEIPDSAMKLEIPKGVQVTHPDK